MENLNDYRIYEKLPNEAFDELVELVSRIFNVPMAMITILDEKRQWFKARRGLSVSETPIELSFCRHTVQNPHRVMIIENALLDGRFYKNDLVLADPNIRFYAGAPLVTEQGVPYGALAIADTKPRALNQEQSELLRDFAMEAMKQINLRKKDIQNQEKLSKIEATLISTTNKLLQAQELARTGSWEWDLDRNDLFLSPQLFKLFGISESTPKDKYWETWWSLILPEDYDKLRAHMRTVMEGAGKWDVEYRIRRPSGELAWIDSKLQSFSDETGRVNRLAGTTQDITDRKIAEQDKAKYLQGLQEMLFGLSHKIRKPVASTMGLAESISAGGLTEKEIRQYAAYFKIAAEELDDFVRQMTERLGLLKKEILKQGS